MTTEQQRPSVVCQREPERSFCSDCPDHEACSTGVPESLVRAPQTPLERQYEVAVKRNRGLDRFSLAPRRKGSEPVYDMGIGGFIEMVERGD